MQTRVGEITWQLRTPTILPEDPVLTVVWWLTNVCNSHSKVSKAVLWPEQSACTHIHTCTQTHRHRHTQTHTDTHRHTQTHTHTHTHTHKMQTFYSIRNKILILIFANHIYCLSNEQAITLDSPLFIKNATFTYCHIFEAFKYCEKL